MCDPAPVPRDVYARLKRIEDKVMRLEKKQRMVDDDSDLLPVFSEKQVHSPKSSQAKKSPNESVTGVRVPVIRAAVAQPESQVSLSTHMANSLRH